MDLFKSYIIAEKKKKRKENKVCVSTAFVPSLVFRQVRLYISYTFTDYNCFRPSISTYTDAFGHFME